MFNKYNGIKQLKPYLMKYKVKIAFFLFFSVLFGFISTLPTLLIGYVIDMITSSNELDNFSLLIYNMFNKNIIAILIFLGFLMIVISILNTLFGYAVSNFGINIKKTIKKDLFQKIICNYDNNNSELKEGELLTRLSKDAECISQIIVAPMNGMVRDIIELLWIIVVFIVWNWKIALISLLFIFPIYFVSRKISNNVKFFSGKILKIEDKINNYFLSLIKNLKVVHLSQSEKEEINIANDFLNDSYNETSKLNKNLSFLFPIISIIQMVGIIVVLIFTYLLICKSDLSVGAITISYLYIQKLYSPISGFSRYSKMLASSDKALSRLFDINKLDYKFLLEDGCANIIKSPNIIIENLCFSYTNKSVFNDLNMVFNKNEITILKAESGGGKSTLVNLMIGHLKPNSGHIKINNFDHSDCNISTFSVLFQDTILFNRSFIENITYGNRDVDYTLMEFLIDELGLRHLIETNGKDFNIDLNNTNLSGGERRRICLLRTLLKKAYIYILDEPTAEVDINNSTKIVDYIKNLKKYSTVIVLTHDALFDDVADKIIEI